MIIRDIPVELTLNYPLEQIEDLDNILFFDIETTGFSAETTYLYLIGCIYHKGGSFHMLQWFSEGIEEEVSLLTKFFDYIKKYKLLIHFNGTGFDIPYLLKKCRIHGLSYSFDHIESLDLYKKVSPHKKILNLSSCRQKSIEAFLSIDREDTASGGELIEVYRDYLGKKHIEKLRNSRLKGMALETESEADKLLYLLLLHNEDDLKGLVQICSILSYADLPHGPFHISSVAVENRQLIIQFEPALSLPTAIHYENDLLTFHAHKDTALLKIQIYEGEMKYYYDNYKDYYYLPAEDAAVHKSLAEFVEKEFRQKARPSSCYTRKTGLFVPQFTPIIHPTFKHKYQDKLTYIEVHTDMLLHEDNLERYVSHLLGYLFSLKSKSR